MRIRTNQSDVLYVSSLSEALSDDCHQDWRDKGLGRQAHCQDFHTFLLKSSGNLSLPVCMFSSLFSLLRSMCWLRMRREGEFYARVTFSFRPDIE